MPLIQYIWKHEEGHDNTEKALLAPTVDIEVEIKRVEPVFKREGVKLLSVKVINPHVHKHTWKKTHQNYSTQKSFYVCQRCKITGYRFLHVVNGEQGSVFRDDKFKNEKKYSDCNDELKKLPKEIQFQ